VNRWENSSFGFFMQGVALLVTVRECARVGLS
jgi:hypothetical protein